ncbi:MAG: aminotransferase class IV family protein [Bacteroidales bacterium]|nr:aminotransferase class IV family protein [Bacteroidales bacterium]
METALLNYFVRDDALHSTCDFTLTFSEKEISIYEVVRVESAAPLFLDAHLKRFYDSASLEGKEIDLHPELIKQSLKVLIEQNMLIFGNIKFLYRWGESGDYEFFAWIMPFFYPDPKQYKEGVCAEIMFAERPNPNSKKVMSGLIKRAEAQISQYKCFEVVYVNTKGEITEGSRSNIFFVKDKQLVTPEMPSVLPGVTRAAIIELAHQNGITVTEKKIPLENLNEYSACFLSGTSPKILPVSRFHDRNFDVNNTLMQYFMGEYDKLCKKEKNDFRW